MFPLNYKLRRLFYFEKTGGTGWTDRRTGAPLKIQNVNTKTQKAVSSEFSSNKDISPEGRSKQTIEERMCFIH